MKTVYGIWEEQGFEPGLVVVRRSAVSRRGNGAIACFSESMAGNTAQPEAPAAHDFGYPGLRAYGTRDRCAGGDMILVIGRRLAPADHRGWSGHRLTSNDAAGEGGF